MSGVPINPWRELAAERERNAALRDRLTIALASRDAFSLMVEEKEKELEIERSRTFTTRALLIEEWTAHANTRKQAREDTEMLHDELEHTQKRLRRVEELLGAPTPVARHTYARTRPLKIERQHESEEY